jgi:primosomal protein N' (replication factor Y)
MRYYECYIKNTNRLLTYSYDKECIGFWVIVSLRNEKRVALVVKEVNKPSFDTFNILEILSFPKSELIPLIEWAIKYYALDEVRAYSLIFPKSVFKISNNICFTDNIPDNIQSFIENRKRVNLDILKNNFSNIQSLIDSGDIYEDISITTKEYEEEKIKYLDSKISLNNEQSLAFDKITKMNSKYFLLRAVTGSGKTAIYIKLIEDAISNGGSVIIMLPEIALANEIHERIKSTIGDICIINSSVSGSKISKDTLDMAKGNIRVVIGTRSAVFAPLKNIKYIIIDEEHETSYKQETSVIYDARTLALKRASLENAKVIMGSATPTIEKYYYAKKNRVTLIEIDKRYRDVDMPKRYLLDMKGHKRIHPELMRVLKDNIAKGEQSLIIIDRKGYSRSMQCSSCGDVEECKRCSVAMTYHKNESLLRCSYCSFEKKYDPICISCGVANKISIGDGTEYIEELLRKELSARVVRFDGIVNKKKGASKKIFQDFRDQNIDILVGTRLVAKGLDFPNITVVAILNVDSSLHFPDFRASEYAFQLIHQASGRAGRSGLSSRVYIQTYNPDHYVMQAKSYEEFYRDEIKIREELQYPPYKRAINIIVKNSNESKCRDLTKRVFATLKLNNIDSYPPVPAHIFKVDRIYRYNIFILCNRIEEISDTLLKISKMNRNIVIDVDPIRSI